MVYYQVLLPVPVKGNFTYLSEEELPIGVRVEVPFGRRNIVGVVYSQVFELDSSITYKSIKRVLDDKSVFDTSYLELINSMSTYYQTHSGLTFMGIMPKSILSSDKIDFEITLCEQTKTILLNEDQTEVYENIKPYIDKGYSTHLIQGITGSGKTEVYMDLARDVMDSGRQVLYLVPEISLTSQLIGRLSGRTGIKLSAYHSRLSPKKRKQVFWGFANGDLPLLIGARSALFIPAKNIGLIIVDEEHEGSFKQEDSVPYHLRDMAVMYGNILKIPVILGSATPSLASYHNALNGRYHYHILNNRYNEQALPHIDIIDMKKGDIIENILSTRLYDLIYKTVEKNDQVILLLNRKGYSSQLICRTCGEHFSCPNCSVSMIYYKAANYAKCSYCDEKISYLICPNCDSSDFIDFGFGTEKAFELLDNLFKGKVLKIDADEITSQKKLDQLLNDFADKKYNIMVGTQIIAKGLNFEDVTLVGVLNIDGQFSLPDFRANEKAFQLLLQVAGRSGRFAKKGTVAVQTFNTDMPLFSMLNSDIKEFYEYESSRREMMGYPPFNRLMRLILTHSNKDLLKRVTKQIAVEIQKIDNVFVLGPAEAPVFKVKNRFRYNILVRSPGVNALIQSGKTAEYVFDKNKSGSMQLRIDVDPYSFM